MFCAKKFIFEIDIKFFCACKLTKSLPLNRRKLRIKFIELGIVGLCIESKSEEAIAARNFDVIAINMPKEEVVSRMDAPGVARGSMINKYGQVIEVREYKVDAGKSPTQKSNEIGFTIVTLGLGAPIFLEGGDIIDTYWLYFCDGRLVQWGKAGDWAEAQKQVYDINFNIHKN